MSHHHILHYPHVLLETPAETVTVFDESLRQLSEDLLKAMYDAPGIGIAAPHIGILKRVVAIDIESGNPRIFINPEIIWSSSELSEATEGSVSMPGVLESVTRPAAIRYIYQDLNGGRHEEDAKGFLSTCLQHEIDQLDGIFWIKRLSRLKRDRLIKRYKKQHNCAHVGCCATA